MTESPEPSDFERDSKLEEDELVELRRVFGPDLIVVTAGYVTAVTRSEDLEEN